MKIQFTSVDAILTGERKSKLLDPQSELYQACDAKYQELKEKYGAAIGAKRMDFHIELVSRNETWSEELVLTRARELHGLEIDMSNICVMGRALVVMTPQVTGYAQPHITLAFFPNGVPLIT